jgi:hypothetical protein
MRNKSKATTLESKFPLLAVENNCIISKDADITLVFEYSYQSFYSSLCGIKPFIRLGTSYKIA